jgi:phosphatidylserine synthase
MPEDLQTRFFDGVPVMAGVAAAYLRLLFCPWPLAISYSLLGALDILAALGFVVASAVIVGKLRRTRPELFRDLLLGYGLTLLPLAAPVLASPLMAEWIQVQDRYAYLASGGACLLVAALLASFRAPALKKLGLAIAVLLIALGAWGTFRQERVWANSEAMWRHALQVTPDAQFVSISLGRDLARDGRFHDAAQVFEDALRYHPHSTSLKNFLIKARRLEEMAPRFQIATPVR